MQNSTLAKIALTAAVAVAGVGFFVKSTLGHTTHYKMVDELMAAGDLAQWKDQEIKVHGWVEAGSIKTEVVNQETQRTFLLQKGGKKIRVFTVGPVPDTFKDQSEVVATGMIVPATTKSDLAASLKVSLEADLAYVVVAKELQAKCPSKYTGAQANKDLKTKYE
ncbi:MAG: cytochrome c maturation protein CcmE [Deltaproteobacteria bacterium]|nr:cytochrome c maturation protein CcmE [Deltaproteobacteria bacterium]MDQ3295251.1 cytochrome c maturation protein CcmE [Myxococcota bacterium]